MTAFALILAIRARADLVNDQVDGRALPGDSLANKEPQRKIRQSTVRVPQNTAAQEVRQGDAFAALPVLLPFFAAILILYPWFNKRLHLQRLSLSSPC